MKWSDTLTADNHEISLSIWLMPSDYRNKCKFFNNTMAINNNVYFVVSTVPVDGLAPLGARPSAGTVMIMPISWLCNRLTMKVLKWLSLACNYGPCLPIIPWCWLDCHCSSLQCLKKRKQSLSEWVIKFISLFLPADIGVHIVHISHVIITLTLESLSSLTKIIHNLQSLRWLSYFSWQNR